MLQMECIKRIREEKDLRQQDVADALHIKRSTYSSYETMRDIIPLKHLNNLCNLLNISLDYSFALTKIINYPKLELKN